MSTYMARMTATARFNYPVLRRLRLLLTLALTFVCTLAVATYGFSTDGWATPGRVHRARLTQDDRANALPLPPIGHEGRWLTDAAGRVLLLHGVNMVSKEAPYYPQAFGFRGADAAWLSQNGFDVVRLGVMATGLMPSPGQIDTGYLNDLAKTVDILSAHHILVLLDFHQDGYGPLVGSDGFPPWMTLTNGAPNTSAPFPLYYIENPAIQNAFQSFWNDQTGPNGVGLQEDDVAMLTAVARRFGADPWVLGYDVMNEPWPGTTWAACLSSAGCPNLDSSELASFYAKADRAIRAADSIHLPFVEPFVLFNFGQSPTTIPLPGGDADSGLSFHQYATSPAGQTGVINQALSWSARTGGALLDTEWGATTDPSAITAQADQLDSAFIPWIFWSFDGDVVNNLSLPPRSSNLNSAVVDALVRPHPLAVAGTPQSYSYSPASRIMTFTYSTARPGGGSFDPSVLTSIEVPENAEPNGYAVTVQGGTVTSPAGAELLTVSSDPHVASVSVTVAPSPGS